MQTGFKLIRLSLLLALLSACEFCNVVESQTVVIDSSAHSEIVEVDARDRCFCCIDVRIPGISDSLIEDGYAVYYLGDQEERFEYGYYSFTHLPKDEQAVALGYRLYNNNDQLIDQDEVRLRLLF